MRQAAGAACPVFLDIDNFKQINGTFGHVVGDDVLRRVAGEGVTVSIGVAVCPNDATTARDLVVRADAALYEAKRTGKNRVVSADRMSTAPPEPPC